ncbi:hypothetical protein niasHT_014179 [Heterodera trifolii]|uniref:Uncharacterized protein n=1 Tax=Heterodera trifolii TaxID=157864 RepID=A0ABD2KX02_9BILA
MELSKNDQQTVRNHLQQDGPAMESVFYESDNENLKQYEAHELSMALAAELSMEEQKKHQSRNMMNSLNGTASSSRGQSQNSLSMVPSAWYAESSHNANQQNVQQTTTRPNRIQREQTGQANGGAAAVPRGHPAAQRHAANSSSLDDAVNGRQSQQHANSAAQRPDRTNRPQRGDQTRQTNAAMPTRPIVQTAQGQPAERDQQLLQRNNEGTTEDEANALQANHAQLTLADIAAISARKNAQVYAKIMKKLNYGNKWAKEHGVHEWAGKTAGGVRHYVEETMANTSKSVSNWIAKEKQAIESAKQKQDESSVTETDEQSHAHANTTPNRAAQRARSLQRQTQNNAVRQSSRAQRQFAEERHGSSSRESNINAELEKIDQMFEQGIALEIIERTLNVPTVEFKCRFARLYLMKAFALPKEEWKKHGVIEKGIGFANEALAIDPTHNDALKYLCMLMGLKIGQIPKTIINAKKIVNLTVELDKLLQRADQHDPEILHAQGRFMYTLKRSSSIPTILLSAEMKKLHHAPSFEAAMEKLIAADEALRGNSIENNFFLAKCYQNLNEKEKAIEYFGKLLRLEPNNLLAREREFWGKPAPGIAMTWKGVMTTRAKSQLCTLLYKDKSTPPTENNVNLGTGKKPETGGTSKMPKDGQPVPNRMAAKSVAAKSLTIKNNNEAGPSQQPKKTTANITPQQKGQVQNSKNPQKELLGRQQKRPTPEEIKAGKQPAMELMPCYRGIGKKTMPTIAQRSATMLKRGDSLTRSADFEDPILANVKQSQMLIRQKSKGTMDLEMDEFLKRHKQIQGPRRKLERMERAKVAKEAAEKAKVDRRNRMLEREKMWVMKKAGAAAHQPAPAATRGRTQQQQQQKLQLDKMPAQKQQQPNKTNRSQNVSAPSTSKQIVNRRLLIGPNKPRTANKTGTTKHGIHSAETMTSSSESNVPKSENLDSSEMETAEEAAKTYLNNLRVDLNKIPPVKIPFLQPIIEQYAEDYTNKRQLFAEGMQNLVRKTKISTKIVEIIEFKKKIEKEMEDLTKHTDLPPDQLIELLNMREWLLKMKKDIGKCQNSRASALNTYSVP